MPYTQPSPHPRLQAFVSGHTNPMPQWQARAGQPVTWGPVLRVRALTPSEKTRPRDWWPGGSTATADRKKARETPQRPCRRTSIWEYGLIDQLGRDGTHHFTAM